MLLTVSKTTTKKQQANTNKYDFLKKKIKILNTSSGFKCTLRHEKGYSSPICLLANLLPDSRYITFQNETEHTATRQGETPMSQEICAGSTMADKITINTLSASVGIFHCMAPFATYG